MCPFAVVVHFWIIFTDQVCDCMEQKTCNRSGLNFIRTCFSPWNWFILAFTMSLNMCLCTLFQTCFLPEIYPLLLSKCVCLCTRAGISAVDERKQVWEIFNLEIWISLQRLQRKIKMFGKTKMFNLRIWFWCLEKTKFSIWTSEFLCNYYSCEERSWEKEKPQILSSVSR